MCATCRRGASVAGAKLKSTRKHDGEQSTIKNERYAMHLLFSPILASAVWIGGGGVGLLLLIVVVVLLVRR
jgi:hypothetical protein